MEQHMPFLECELDDSKEIIDVCILPKYFFFAFPFPLLTFPLSLVYIHLTLYSQLLNCLIFNFFIRFNFIDGERKRVGQNL